MINSKTKIKLLKTLNHSKNFSLYKISVSDLLEWKDNGIDFKYHSGINQEDILSISKYTPGGLNLESWIKIEFMQGVNKKEIYITSRSFWGFGSIFGDNEQIEEELKRRYLRNE